jgi:diguanylate cyclase (GGDEF)-like protein/PAS domain S-box-containing protein
MPFMQRLIIFAGYCSAIVAAAIIIADHYAGAPNSGAMLGLAGGFLTLFAAVVALREYWIATMQRRLRRYVDRGRSELEASRQRLTAVLESTTDSVLVIDRDWRITYFNRHAAETINQRDKLKDGVSIWELFPAALTSGEGDHYRRAFATGQAEEFEIFVEDRQIWLRIHAYPSADGLSIFFRDVSAEKRARDEVQYLAHHDALTGLANRALFQRELEMAVASGAPLAVLLVDLDHFKDVNDTLGHPVGDRVLVDTAARMRRCLGPEATIARLGGDEFAAIVTGHEGRDELGVIAEKLIEAANTPHLIDRQPVRVSVSIGVTVGFPHDLPAELFKKADIALYAAKSEARGGFRFFEPAMEIALSQKQALRTDLAGALERGEFVLAYQALVDLNRDGVAGFEALLRWNHPVRGQVSPETFIPIAEDTGLIVELGKWVLRSACAEATAWPSHISVAINLSSRQFVGGDLPRLVEQVLAETGLPASRLELEITETVLLRDSVANMQMLKSLRDLGVRIALDDFGTGFSSLVYLQRFPFSKIKIDRTFVAGLPESEESQAIVRSIIGLGQSLGLRVTAEGVETQAQLDWVRNGCDEAQGYLLSEPVPASEVADVITRLEGRRRPRLAG